MGVNALTAPALILNSFGFSGAESLASYLAGHPQLGLLPGQNFIQQNSALYRPLRLERLDADGCFHLLSTRQFTKSGVQWAGLGKFMSSDYKSRYSDAQHRAFFIQIYDQLGPASRACFVTMAKLYTYCFFQAIDEDVSAVNYYGFYGGNILVNSVEYDNFNDKTICLQVLPDLAEWLSLASQSRTWNPESAFGYYLIQRLIIKRYQQRCGKFHQLSFRGLVLDTADTMQACCDFLGISGWDKNYLAEGEGHVPVSDTFYRKVFDDARAIAEIYQKSEGYELVSSFDEWSMAFLSDSQSSELLETYCRYWNSTSHIAFDWCGPLEQQILAVAKEHAASCAGIPITAPGKPVANAIEQNSIAYQFYQQWFELSSVNYQQAEGLPCFPLGCLETDLPLPQLQYFMRIAITYLHSCAELQGKQAHSYSPLRNGDLYRRLAAVEMQKSIDRNFLRTEWQELEQAIDATEDIFKELHGSRDEDEQPVVDVAGIAVSGPDITEHEKLRVMQALGDWYREPYYFCEEFERRFADYHARRFALMTPNCTSANHLLLLGLGIGPGDEVLVPECTWIASASPVYHTGATPVFCDIDPLDWCISLESIRQQITPRTRAIVVVNLYGNMARMDELEALAAKHNLYLIEDAAESIGSVYKGRRSGQFGVGSVFSFHRTKTLTTGEGGILLLDNPDLYARCVKLRDHGRGPETPAYQHDIIGHKFMPFNLQAALGLAQFERLDELIAKKRHMLEFYKNRLGRFDGLVFNDESDHVFNSAWCTTMVIGEQYGIGKIEMMSLLQDYGIPSRPFFYPLSSQPGVQRKHAKLPLTDYETRNPVAYRISRSGINLPSALNLDDQQLDYICCAVEAELDNALRGISKAA